MKKILILSLLVVLVLVLFCSCSNTLTAAITEEENPNMIKISLEDISASTGYVWDYSISDESVVKFVSKSSSDPDVDAVGVPVTTTWIFEGLKDGECVITMMQTPPGNDSPERTIDYYYQIIDNVAVRIDTLDSDKQTAENADNQDTKKVKRR